MHGLHFDFCVESSIFVTQKAIIARESYNIINNNYFKYDNEIENNDFINRKTYMEFLILNYGSLLFEKNIYFNYSLFEEFEARAKCKISSLLEQLGI